MRQRSRDLVDNIDTVNFTYARLNAGTGGMDLEIFLTKSPAFDYTVPDENSLYDYFGLVGPQFEGRINPAVADGYWASAPASRRLHPGIWK